MRTGMVLVLAALLAVPLAQAGNGDQEFNLVGNSQQSWKVRADGGDLRFSVETQGPAVVRDMTLLGPGTCRSGTGTSSAVMVGAHGTILAFTCRNVPPGSADVTLRLGQGAAHGALHMSGGTWTR